MMMTTTTITRKRGKAQPVAHPACANSTVHFLLTYMLLSTTYASATQRMTFNISAVRSFCLCAHIHLLIYQNILEVTGRKFTKFYGRE